MSRKSLSPILFNNSVFSMRREATSPTEVACEVHTILAPGREDAMVSAVSGQETKISVFGAFLHQPNRGTHALHHLKIVTEVLYTASQGPIVEVEER